MWRGGKTEHQHLVWAVVVSLVLHAGIVVAVSLHLPAASTSIGHDRQLITTLELGEATAEPRQKPRQKPTSTPMPIQSLSLPA